MRLVIHSSFSQPPLLQRGRPLVSQYRRRQQYLISVYNRRPPRYSLYRSGGFSSKCSIVDVVVDVDASSISMEDETSGVPILTKDEQDALAATPPHLANLYALYASFLVGNMVDNCGILHGLQLLQLVIQAFCQFLLWVSLASFQSSSKSLWLAILWITSREFMHITVLILYSCSSIVSYNDHRSPQLLTIYFCIGHAFPTLVFSVGCSGSN